MNQTSLHPAGDIPHPSDPPDVAHTPALARKTPRALQRRRPGAAPESRDGTYQTGLFGEEVVCEALVANGWRLLGRRVRTRRGEIDVIARRGDVIVFGEVKTSGQSHAPLGELVDQKAQHRIRRAAIAWMAVSTRLQRGVRRYRFDVFLVVRSRTGAVDRIDHIPDAF